MLSRRDFIKLGAVFIGSAVCGGIGGVTAKESGEWGESEDDEPPSQARAGEEQS